MARRTRSWSWDNKSKQLSIDGKVDRDYSNSDNTIQNAGATTGNPPSLTASGNDTNIDLRLVAKGDGNIEVRSNLEILTNKRIVDSAGTNVEFGDDIHMNSNKVTNLGTPSASTDAATKGYVDTYSLLLASGGTIAADLTVTGNLTVSGTTTTINTATLSVADNIVNLNSDFTSGAPTENAGLQVVRGDSSNVQLRWNETSDSWEVTRDGSTYVKIPNQALDTTDSPTFATVTYTTLNDGSNSITATAAEINVLDGITATVSELNILDGVTATTAELNYVDGVTSAIQTQIDGKLSLTGGTVSGATTFQNTVNISGGSAVLQIGGASITASAAELNLLDGVTATTAEINYLDGVTSNIQTQIDNISSSFTLSDNQGTPNTDTFTTGQTLTFAGSTGIDTTVSDNQVAIAIDSTVATLTGTQTLTNKTINSASNTITITESDISDLGSYITASSTDTLTNKTLTTPIISNISNTGTLTLPTSTDTLVGRATTDTLTNKTLTSPTVGTNLDLNARAPVQFYDTDSSNYIGLRAPSTVASNYTFTLPAQDGTSQQVLVTDGAGNWSFANQSGGGGASGFQSSTLSTHPAASGDEDLATGPSDDTVETPFESSGTDAFGVSLGAVYDQMEPVGSTSTTDLGDSEAYVGA